MNRTTPRTNSPARESKAHLDTLLDDALADTFPASDPVSNLTADIPVRVHDPERNDKNPP